YRWPMERAIELSIEATSFAHEQGLYVSYFPIDASRADITEYMNLIERIAQEGWMDAIGCVDTFGVLTRHAVAFFIRKTNERVKNTEPTGKLTEPFPFLPELVGHEPVKVVLGKGSGIDSIHYHLDRMGIKATDEEAMDLLQQVKSLSLDRKALIDLDEFRKMAE